MKLIVLLGWLVFGSLNSLAQPGRDSIHNSISIPQPAGEKALELSNSKKVILLKKGRRVWVQYEDSKGKMKLKRAELVSIKDHEFTVKPIEYVDKELTYTDSTVTVIGYTTTGRIIARTPLNTVIVSVGIGCSVIVIAFAALEVVFYPLLIFGDYGRDFYSFKWVKNAFRKIGELFRLAPPFHRNIKLHEKKWKLRTVEVNDGPKQ